MHNRPSCCHGLDDAATWARACELTVVVHCMLCWRVIPQRPARSKWTKTGPCLDWHMIAQSVFGMFGMLFTIVFDKMVIKWLVMAADAGGILTDLVTVNANWECCSGSFGLQHSERLGGQDYVFFYSHSLAIMLEPTRRLTGRFFRLASPMMRAGKQQAGRVLPVCNTLSMLFSPGFRILQCYSGLATGSALRMALIWSHTYNSFHERATNEAEEVHSRSHKHSLCSNFGEPSARPEAGEGIEVARACASDQKSQPRYRKPSARGVMRSETIASRRMLGLKTCVTSEEFVGQVQDEWREAQANRYDAEPNAHGEEEDGFGFGHQEVRGDVERHIEGKAVCRFYENVLDASELIKKAYAARAKGTFVDRDQRQSVPIQGQAERGNREVLRASRRSYLQKFDLQGESRATHQHLLQGLRERRRRPHQDHLDEGLLWRWSRWSDTVANQFLRVHSCGRCFAWDRRVYVVEHAQRFLRDRAAL